MVRSVTIQNALSLSLSGHNYCALNYTTAYGIFDGKICVWEIPNIHDNNGTYANVCNIVLNINIEHKDQNVCVCVFEDSIEQLNGRCK